MPHGLLVSFAAPSVGEGLGTLLIPNTVAVVQNGPNAAHAGALIDHLLSHDTQRTLALSDSANMPVDPALAQALCAWAPAHDAVWPVHLDRVADAVEQAMRTCDQVLG